MSRLHKFVNLLGVVLPFAGFLLAIILLWHRAVGVSDLVVMAVFYFFTGLGITLGYHRLFTHRGMETSAPMRAALGVLGGMALEGSLITWVADHRKHHVYSDVEGDPHSPHLSGPGFVGAVRGLWHAHMGWLFETIGQADLNRYTPDLMKDPLMRTIDRLFPLWIVLTLVLPFGIGWVIGGSLTAAFLCFLWAGAARIFLLHHVTWSINSVCHFFGRRRFDVEDYSTNVIWLAPFSLGESWHHNHHAFPTSAFHGLSRWEHLADPTGLLVSFMEKVGLVWNVVRVTPEKQAAKLVANVTAAAERTPVTPTVSAQ